MMNIDYLSGSDLDKALFDLDLAPDGYFVFEQPLHSVQGPEGDIISGGVEIQIRKEDHNSYTFRRWQPSTNIAHARDVARKVVDHFSFRLFIGVRDGLEVSVMASNCEHDILKDSWGTTEEEALSRACGKVKAALRKKQND